MTPIARWSFRSQALRRRVTLTPGEQELRDCGVMEHLLIAAGKCRANALALGGPIPIGSGRDRAVVSGEADQYRLMAILLTRELTDIELAALAHLRRACVAEMRIMLPNRKLRTAAFPAEMGNQRVERFGHMAVAQVP